MSRNFLGRGIAFPLRIDGGGGLSMSQYDENIEECVRIVLGTAVGERIYRPLFGCRVHDLLFEPNNPHTRTMAAHHVKEALDKWEPRIRDINIHSRQDPDDPNAILIDIKYSVRATNSVWNLVYPFYLRREEDL